MKSLLSLVVMAMLYSLTGSSCRKEESLPSVSSDLTFQIHYEVDGIPLLTDSIRYTNQAGNEYSVNHLEYYLSGLELYGKGQLLYRSDAVYYINALKAETNQMVMPAVPHGTYDSAFILLGLDSLHNLTHALPNTLDNFNMAWPPAMGGGYHFMKLEGYFKDAGGSTQSGYAMHLGKNPNLVRLKIVKSFIHSNDSKSLFLTMNINEWYKNPLVYDFETDGNYSMGSAQAMLKLKTNGSYVFTLKEQ